MLTSSACVHNIQHVMPFFTHRPPRTYRALISSRVNLRPPVRLFPHNIDAPARYLCRADRPMTTLLKQLLQLQRAVLVTILPQLPNQPWCNFLPRERPCLEIRNSTKSLTSCRASGGNSSNNLDSSLPIMRPHSFSDIFCLLGFRSILRSVCFP